VRIARAESDSAQELDGLSAPLRIAFVSGQSSWLRKQRLVAKYLRMRFEGVVYPDVYCLALMLAGKFDFLQEGEKISRGQYDLVLAELQSSESQLRYLESLVEAGSPPVAVIPGPPAILARDLTDAKLRRVKRILSEARYVWAYAPELKTFCDGLIGRERATIIPWPYDFGATRKLAAQVKPPRRQWNPSTSSRQALEHGHDSHDEYKILVQVPMAFHDVVQNHPFVLKSVLLDLWPELPAEFRERLRFHTVVYHPRDRELYKSTGFADGLPFVLDGKRGYRAFVRFLAECDGVVNLTAGSILGRVTFLAAALDRPGIFSDNSELNRQLYPNSCVAMFDTVRLRELLRAMLLSLAAGAADPKLLPSEIAAHQIGDFAANCERLRRMLEL
jgi:hypothetical protein